MAGMIEVRQTAEFSDWLRRLKDAQAAARIVARIRRMEMENPGDTRSVGRGVMEMRIAYGPGYRVYYVHRGATIVILLCGGDKRTQRRDIRRAQELAETQWMAKTAPKTTRFDAASYLDSEARQVAYIAAALETGDADFVRDALGIVARARGMGTIAKTAGLNRESLYKALGEAGNPALGTVMRVLNAMASRSPRTRPPRRARRRSAVTSSSSDVPVCSAIGCAAHPAAASGLTERGGIDLVSLDPIGQPEPGPIVDKAPSKGWHDVWIACRAIAPDPQFGLVID